MTTANEECLLASLCLNTSGYVAWYCPHAMLVSGICWTGAYILYIAGSHRLRRYAGVPFVALVLNLTWEFVFGFVWTAHMDRVQLIVNRVWFSFDVVLLAQYLKFHKTWTVVGMAGSSLLTATLIAFLVCLVTELSDYNGIYMAFGQNLVMSILFYDELGLLEHKEEIIATDNAWTSWGAGILRWVGTAAASLCISTTIKDPIRESPLLMLLFVGCFVWDTLYVARAYYLWRVFSKRVREPLGQTTPLLKDQQATAKSE